MVINVIDEVVFVGGAVKIWKIWGQRDDGQPKQRCVAAKESSTPGGDCVVLQNGTEPGGGQRSDLMYLR